MVKNFINTSPENTLKNVSNEKAWDEPIVGFSSGADDLFQFYKKDIGDFYLAPIEFFDYDYPNLTIKPIQLTVISWILPQTKATKIEHRKQNKWPTERWARARIFGEEVNIKLRKFSVQTPRVRNKSGYSISLPFGLRISLKNMVLHHLGLKDMLPMLQD